jgi:hypothetical protein
MTESHGCVCGGEHTTPSASLDDVNRDGPCPKCGAETELGFGLMGGGYGTYRFCTSEACDYFIKHQEEEAP